LNQTAVQNTVKSESNQQQFTKDLQRHYDDICSICLVDTFRLNESGVPQVPHYIHLRLDGIETSE